MGASSSIFRVGRQYNDDIAELIFNGELIDEQDGYILFSPFKEKHETAHVCINSQDFYRRIKDYSLEAIVRKAANTSLTFNWQLYNNLQEVGIESIAIYNYDSYRAPNKKKEVNVGFDLFLDGINWKKEWSLNSYLESFFSTVKDYDETFQVKGFRSSDILDLLESNSSFDSNILYSNLYKKDFPKVSLRISIIYTNFEASLSDVIDRCIQIFTKAHLAVVEKYQSSLTTYSLTERFNFPPEVKTACEQYLLYFAEFLKDVGIKVSTNITKEDQDVILTVIPESKEDALEKIGHLLNLYLHLPNGTLVNDYQLNADMGIQAQKLYGQIKQLESQLSYANAENQLLQLTVDGLKGELRKYDSQILLESKTDKSRDKDKEPVIGSPDSAIVSLTEFEFWGVNVNLANLLRALKKAVNDD